MRIDHRKLARQASADPLALAASRVGNGPAPGPTPEGIESEPSTTTQDQVVSAEHLTFSFLGFKVNLCPTGWPTSGGNAAKPPRAWP